MTPRARAQNVRKVCRCGWKRWPKCPHAWYFSFKPRGGRRYRFSLDAELGHHVESKTDAENAAAPIRAAILDGTFACAADRHARAQRAAAEPRGPEADGVSLDQFAAVYIERASKASGKASWKDDEYLLGTLRSHRTAAGHRLGDCPVSTITEDELEAFHAGQRAAGRANSTLNHYVQVFKAAFRWGVKKGYLPRSPVSEDSTLRRTKVAQRRRRVSPAEEASLLTTASHLSRGAGLRLQWLIIAAIETGARLGELLSLLWADVNLEKRTVLVRAVAVGAKKTGRSRRLPMSARLAAVLEMATLDPAGRRYPPTAHVFGSIGARIDSIDKVWNTCVLRAHGHEPAWTATGALAAAARVALKAIDLHFHDLRHEAGCRWLEAGWPIHHVQEMLGHANLSQTSTYLHASELGLEESMRRFDGERGKPVAKEDASEHRPLSHEEAAPSGKDLLH